MLATLAKLALAAAVLVLLTPSADAQRGGIGRRPGTNRKRWYSKRGEQSTSTKHSCNA
jgi:hypothetical protein